MKNLAKEKILAAFKELSCLYNEELTLVMGGGGALVVAYGFPLATEDVDAFSKEKSLPQLDVHVKTIAKKLGIAPDWLNSYYSSFTGVLPKDYSTRLKLVFHERNLKVLALGPEDLLIMKCFAGREKDIPHAKALLKQKIDLGVVEDRLQELIDQKYPRAEKARDFFDEISGDL